MERNVKVARQLLKVAKMLVADSDGIGEEFVDKYNYVDANSDFKTVYLERKSEIGVLKFDVVLTEKVRLHVEVDTYSGFDWAKATVTTTWQVDDYKRSGFQPDVTPQKKEIGNVNSVDELSGKVTEIVAARTKGLTLNKG